MVVFSCERCYSRTLIPAPDSPLSPRWKGRAVFCAQGPPAAMAQVAPHLSALVCLSVKWDDGICSRELRLHINEVMC